LVFSSFVALFAFASDPATLFALRAAAGVGDAACIVGSVTMINDLAPDSRRGEAYSLYSLAAWAGLGLGPVIGDFVHRASSFDAVWVVAIALSLSGAALAVALPETRPQITRSRPAFAFLSRYAAVPGAVIALEMFGFAALVVFSPLYARELGMQGAGLVLLVNAAVLGSPAGLYLGAAVFGAGHALLYPALFLLAVGRAPEDERSAALGSLKALEGLGFAVAAAFIGLTASLGGYSLAFAVGAAVTATGLIPLRVFLPRSRIG